MEELQIMILENNNLSGNIPKSRGRMLPLLSVYLANNSITTASLLTILNSTHLSNDPDSSTWQWTARGVYSSKSSYKFFFKTNCKNDWSVKVWKLKVPTKIRFFIWLIGLNRLPTQENLIRKGWTSIMTCTLCSSGIIEIANDLFTHCPYSMRFWRRSGFSPLPSDSSNLAFWRRIRNSQLTIEDKIHWDVYWAAGSWTLWKQRNQRVFTGRRAPTSITYQMASQEAHLWKLHH
ncbi:hypothetical protein LUZ60_014956 [Juncus effusus]|nr:hypothetical protein LUZ60_014956 [Juncus effusus]